MINTQTLCLWAKELGFAEMKLCTPDHFERSKRIVESQEPLAERKQLRFFPQKDDPEIRSLAVLLWPYKPASLGGRESVFVDSYYEASNAAYHAARELERRLLAGGCFAKANVSYPAKEAAIRAGLGIIGQNSLLITPEYGSRIVIILMATAIDIESAPAPCPGAHSASCLRCGRCAKACPSGAIDETGMAHPEKCLRNFMMEGVIVPERLRPSIGMRLIGCDICQRVCPMQPDFSHCHTQNAYSLCDFVTADQMVFSDSVARLAKEIGRNTARPQRVRAQAALLAGNSRNRTYLPVLYHWSESPFDAVRQHALWAIGQIELADANT